jgi:cell division control protein 6
MIDEILERQISGSSVFKNRDVLSPHYVPDHLPYREEQVEELTRTLAPILSGRKPENVFIYGKTGTGKTAVTKFVTKKIHDFAEKRGINVRAIYINCRMHNTRTNVLVKIGKELMPDENFLGLSSSYIYERILDSIRADGKRMIVILDEIDSLKGLSETVYTLNRANDELENGSISIVGISNVLTLKDKLDPRTKSTLCQKEMIFPPYDANGLRKILEDRAKEAFKEGAITEAVIARTAAYAAKQSGDARYALQLLLRAGDIADEEGASVVTEEHVEKAKARVEEDIILDMVANLPKNEKIVLLAIAGLAENRKGIQVMGDGEPIITSGEVYTAYQRLARKLGKDPVSDRWFREYISDLAMYGLLEVTQAGKGFRGNTRLIRLKFDPKKIRAAIEPTIVD